MGNFQLFQQVRCEVIVKYTNSNLLEHEWIRRGIRTLEAKIEEKNKKIEGRQNVTGSYIKKKKLLRRILPQSLKNTCEKVWYFSTEMK